MWQEYLFQSSFSCFFFCLPKKLYFFQILSLRNEKSSNSLQSFKAKTLWEKNTKKKLKDYLGLMQHLYRIFFICTVLMESTCRFPTCYCSAKHVWQKSGKKYFALVRFFFKFLWALKWKTIRRKARLSACWEKNEIRPALPMQEKNKRQA